MHKSDFRPRKKLKIIKIIKVIKITVFDFIYINLFHQSSHRGDFSTSFAQGLREGNMRKLNY